MTTMTERLETADGQRRSGDEAAALEAYAGIAIDAHAAFDLAAEALAMLAIGELRLLAEDLRGAREALGQAIGRAMEAGLPIVEADAHFMLATAFFDAGASKDGHDALLEAMALYRETPGREVGLKLARAIRLYGEHLGILGDDSEARQAFELARFIFAELGEAEAAQGVAEDLKHLGDFTR